MPIRQRWHTPGTIAAHSVGEGSVCGLGKASISPMPGHESTISDWFPFILFKGKGYNGVDLGRPGKDDDDDDGTDG